MHKIILFLLLSISFSYADAEIPYAPLKVSFEINKSFDPKIEEEFCHQSDNFKQKMISNLKRKSSRRNDNKNITLESFPETEHMNFFSKADNESAWASYKLAVIHASGKCIKRDFKQAISYLKSALIVPQSNYIYAMILIHQKRDINTAFQLLNIAGDLGHDIAPYNAAVMLYKKSPKIYAKQILDFLQLSAKNGYIRAFNDLGVFMMSDFGSAHKISFRDQRNQRLVEQYLTTAEDMIDYAASFNDSFGLYNKAAFLYQKQCDGNQEEIAQNLYLSSKKKLRAAILLLDELQKDDCMGSHAQKTYKKILVDFDTNLKSKNNLKNKIAILYSDAFTQTNLNEKIGVSLSPKYY